MNLVFRGELLELRPQRPQALAIDGHNRPDTIAQVFGAMEHGASIALLNTRLTAHERQAQLARLEPHEGPATLLFTSGTTGAPKARRITLQNHEASARAANEVLQIDSASRFLCTLPLFHVGGLAIAFRTARAGATMILHERFDAQEVARSLREGATHVSLVANTLARLLDTGATFDNHPLAIVGGGPAPAALLDKARAAGLRVVRTWGMTETASMATCERPGDADGTTAGPPLPGFEIRIEEGEIQVRGPAVISPGWLRTGDLGEIDARGRLNVFARRSDLIISGGENVYPAEIEAALLQHPRVSEAAVLPAADATWGQVGVAYVNTTAAESELRAFLCERLARYKIPARFVRLDVLPRNAAGKVDRLKLLAAERSSPAAP